MPLRPLVLVLRLDLQTGSGRRPTPTRFLLAHCAHFAAICSDLITFNLVIRRLVNFRGELELDNSRQCRCIEYLSLRNTIGICSAIPSDSSIVHHYIDRITYYILLWWFLFTNASQTQYIVSATLLFWNISYVYRYFHHQIMWPGAVEQ